MVVATEHKAMKQNIAKDNNRDDFIKVWDVFYPIRWTNLSVVSPKTELWVTQRQIGKIWVVFLKFLWKTQAALSTTSNKSSLANVRNVPHETFHR